MIAISWLAIYEHAFVTRELRRLGTKSSKAKMELYRRRLVHYHYIKGAEKYNKTSLRGIGP
jgi:hypothetical protein